MVKIQVESMARTSRGEWRADHRRHRGSCEGDISRESQIMAGDGGRRTSIGSSARRGIRTQEEEEEEEEEECSLGRHLDLIAVSCSVQKEEEEEEEEEEGQS